jgi:hypothetical protein
MEIRSDVVVPFPRPQVFAAYRDELPNMLSLLPNVRAIEIKSRKDDGATTELLNVWRGGGDIPAAARAFLSESMLTWDDHARWNAETFSVHWVIKPHAFTEAVFCEGENTFHEVAGGTELRIRGELRIDGGKLKGVPRLVSGKVASLVEDLLGKKVPPNLIETAKAVGVYLGRR